MYIMGSGMVKSTGCKDVVYIMGSGKSTGCKDVVYIMEFAMVKSTVV